MSASYDLRMVMKTMLQFVLGAFVLVYVPMWGSLLMADFVESRKGRVPESVQGRVEPTGATPDCVKMGVEYNSLPPTMERTSYELR